MKRFSLIAILLAAVLSIALAGCGGGGSTPEPTPVPTVTPSPSPTSTPTTEAITEDEMNKLLDITEKAMMRDAGPTECFAEPDVDCGGLGRMTPQAIVDYFGTEKSAFKSFHFTSRLITGPDTLELQLEYVWADTETTVPQGPCIIQVTKTSKGWLICGFDGVLKWFSQKTIQSHILNRK